MRGWTRGDGVLVAVVVFGCCSPGLAANVTTVLDQAGAGVGAPLVCGGNESRICRLVVDGVGNLYASANGSDNVIRVEPGGTKTEIIDAAGDGAGNGLNGPRSLAVDASDNVYVVGASSHNVFRITPAGTVTEIADASDGLYLPTSVAADAAGNVFVASRFDANLFKITPAGVVSVILDANGGGVGQRYSGGNDLAVDGAGNVYVTATDTLNESPTRNVLKIEPDGTVTEIFDNPEDEFGSIAVDGSGNVFVQAGAKVLRIEPGGTATTIVDETGTGTDLAFLGTFAGAGPLAVDAGGNVYSGGYVITPSGRISKYFFRPHDVAVDGSGAVFAVELQADRVAKIEFVCGGGVLGPNEECDDGNATDGDCCSSSCAAEVVCPACETCDPALGSCVQTPRAGCFQPGDLKSRLLLKDVSPDDGDRLVWKWGKGDPTSLHFFGDPVGTDDYTVCLYQGAGTPSLEMAAAAPAGGSCLGKPCWKPKGSRGFRYSDKDVSPDGLGKILLKSSVTRFKAKVVVKGSGATLPMPTLPLTLPVTLQVQATNGQCWEAAFFERGLLRNDGAQFKAKSGSPSGAFVD